MPDTKTKTLDQTLFEMDSANKVYEYFETVLGCTPEQADVASRTLRHKFTWSGVRLLYNGDAGSEKVVAVDHVDQVREFLVRDHFDFLLPTPKVAVEGFPDTSIPADLLQAALDGSMTAKSKICLDHMGGNTKDAAARTELLLKAERAKRDGTVNGTVDNHPHGQTQTERRTTSTNPFLKLSTARNPAERAAATTAISSLIRAVGTAKAAAIARGAGLTLSGQPLRQ